MQMFGKAMRLVVASQPASPVASTLIDADGDVFDDAEEAHLHPDAHEDGGIACNDLALLDRQREAIVEVMKTLAGNLLTGNFDLLRISLPVKLFEPRSYLQKLADPWVYPRLLDAAAAAGADPVQRLRWVVNFVVAGFHRTFLRFEKPFNPILGETWQAALPDGTAIFLEQVSHHPPVSAFQMFGPHGAYYFHGLSQPSIQYKANAIKTSAKGYRRLEFADGGSIEIHYPAYDIKGLLYTGAPRAGLGGTTEFVDAQNGLMAVVSVGRIEGAPAGSVLARPDALSGAIYRTRVHPGLEGGAVNRDGGGGSGGSAAGLHRSKSVGGRGLLSRTLTSAVRRSASSAGVRGATEEAAAGGEVRIPVAHCTGNWLSHLDWDGERRWTLSEEHVATWAPDPHPLPSDARFRTDLEALARGDVAAAQEAKEALENAQRADAKLRKSSASST